MMLNSKFRWGGTLQEDPARGRAGARGGRQGAGAARMLTPAALAATTLAGPGRGGGL